MTNNKLPPSFTHSQSTATAGPNPFVIPGHTDDRWNEGSMTMQRQSTSVPQQYLWSSFPVLDLDSEVQSYLFLFYAQGGDKGDRAMQ